MKLEMQRERRRAAAERLDMMWGELPLLQGESQGAKNKNVGKLTVHSTAKLPDFQ